VLTGRWVEAAEALALGLVNRVCDEPNVVAEEIAADLARRGVGAGVSGVSGVFGVKAVMAAEGLLGRMQAERSANRSAWDRVTGAIPTAFPEP
jgi:enoyl-CoA hydratase/carnithine racemase